MRAKDVVSEPLRITPVDDEVVFLGDGAVNFSMTAEAAYATFWRLADALRYLARRPAKARAGHAVVLLVEDEPLIRRLGVVVLEEAGYAVIEAEGSADALDALETGREVDLLFTDIQISGSLDGLQLAHLVSQRWPTVRLLICSGQVHPDRLPAHGQFLPKPYAVEDMLKRVSKLIAA